MIRATDDVEKVRMFIGQGLLMVAQALLLLTGALVLLWVTNPRLTLVVLPVLPLAFAIFMIFGRIAQPLFMQVQIKLSRLNTILQENLAGIKVVKAFVREPEQQARFAASTEDLMQQQIKVSRTFAFLFPVIFLIANLGQAAVFFFGGRQIIYGTLTLGEWQKFSLYLAYVFFPLGMLGFIINQMSQAGASAQRIFEISDTQNEVANKPDAENLPPVQGRVAFENVTFSYFGGADPVLKEVSFGAEPGQTVALLGATGSGKSSIINLIPRFYDASQGAVKIDGHDVRDVCLDSLRAQIGIVLQDTTLFTGTIRDNIAFGRPDASMEDVVAAAQAAAAHEFILEFAQGYDTPVGERGTTLSGGQKQRIAIARALLMDPHILILDDSTSSVDAVTEYTIQQALDRLMKGRTSFVIAQRISTVRNADLILVLDRGRIAAQGKHEDLMEESAIYAEIYASQLVEDAHVVDEGRTDEGRRCVLRRWSFVFRQGGYDMHGFGGGPRGLLEQEVSKPKNVNATLGRLGRLFGPFWLMLLLVLVLVVGSTYVQVITPELIGQSVDCYLAPGDRRPVRDEHGRSVRDGCGRQGLDQRREHRLLVCHLAPRHRRDARQGDAAGLRGRARPHGARAGDPVRPGLRDERAAVLRDELDRPARAQGPAHQRVQASARAVAELLRGARVRRGDEPHHQRHGHPPAGDQLRAGAGAERPLVDRLDRDRDAADERALRAGQHVGDPADDHRDVVVLRPGAQGVPPRPRLHRRRQRRSAAKHRGRARGAGVRPRGRQHRELPRCPTPPTATPTSKRSPSPRRWRRRWRRWATWPSPSPPSRAGSSCCATRPSSARPSPSA